jgi:hypothetical protein
MDDGERDRQMRNQPAARIFIASCVAVFLVIAGCAAYFVIRILA